VVDLPGEGLAGDRALEAYIRESGDTIFHPVGTCEMGTDPMAVAGPPFACKVWKRFA